ncbi:hypothetical protein D3C85_1718020 [compost metagenome]
MVANTVAYRLIELLQAPAADAGVGILSYVGRLDGAKRRLQRVTAGVGLPAGHGVAGGAVTGRGNVLPTL